MGFNASVNSLAPALLEALDGVWRADELARAQQIYVPSGHGELDPELPGQGWPLGQLTEILQAQPGRHEWRLLLPALRQVIAQGPLVLVGAPQLPNLPALSLLGIPARQVLRVDAHSAAERLWATEQVLRGRELGALLSWLPQARPEQLRRLQLASTATQALVFVFRPLAARHESSPAPLRLALQTVPPLTSHAAQDGDHGLSVALLKRRGPVMAHPLTLAAPLPVMAVLRQRRLPEEPDHAVACPASTHRPQPVAA